MTKVKPIVMLPSLYQHSPEQLREFMSKHDLYGAEVAALLDVDGTTVRRWLAEDHIPNRRRMPYSAWYTLCHRVTGKPPQYLPPGCEADDS